MSAAREEGSSSGRESLFDYLRGEALPTEANYRSIGSIERGAGRPSLDILHNQATVVFEPQENDQCESVQDGSDQQQRGKIVKLGWLEGVTLPVLLNIWGVMLFLRLSWVVGEAGIVFGIIIIVLAHCITLITTLSMSAVATNGQIKGGGGYYMISRSLGPQFGGSIGLTITVASSIATATYIIGFVNSIQDMCREYGMLEVIIPGTGGGKNDVRILSVITLVILLIPAIVGMEWVSRVQKLLLVILLASQINFLVGSFIGPQSDLEEAQGFVGFDGSVMQENAKTDYRFFESDHSFFTVFGVFFPAVTDIVVGANISGDLKDASSAIPKGTLLAIGLTFCTYIVYPILMAASVVRHSTGNLTEYLMYKNEGLSPLSNPVFNVSSCGLYETGQSMCKYGSQNSVQVMGLMSAWAPLVYLGCFAATLSSALACLVAAPRVLQALAKDKLYPLLYFFAKGYGVNNNPIRGYGVVAVICFVCVMIAELNAVGSLLTNCFLASYSLINFSCFHASIAKSPGWRPSFKFYNSWLSLVGGILCVVVMFLIDPIAALVTFLIALFLYLYVAYRKPAVNWGSSTQAQTYNSALKTSLELISVEEHVKNYRPEIILLSGSPPNRPALVDFANSITKGISFLSCANITEEHLNYKMRNYVIERTYKWFHAHKIKSFFSLLESSSLLGGSKVLVQTMGLGKLRPNILMVGYKNNWRDCDTSDLRSYFHVLHEALNMHMGLVILRVKQGFDFSHVVKDEVMPNSDEVTPIRDEVKVNGNCGLFRQESVDSCGPPQDTPTSSVKTPEFELHALENGKKKGKASKKEKNLFLGIDGKEVDKDLLNEITRFRVKQKGTIDVWWLYDDGGLTVLLPYILSKRSQWSGCKLRLFALSNRKDELEAEQRNMVTLLSKFRIGFDDMIILPDITESPKESVRMQFNNIINNFKINPDNEKENIDLMVTSEILLRNKEKTNRHLRLRELLLENSKDASLIVMTLPIPKKHSVSASLYMAWLEILSKDMPPFLFIRGNQTSVLTYYS